MAETLQNLASAEGYIGLARSEVAGQVYNNRIECLSLALVDVFDAIRRINIK